jgi:hypothetical protein
MINIINNHDVLDIVDFVLHIRNLFYLMFVTAIKINKL